MHPCVTYKSDAAREQGRQRRPVGVTPTRALHQDTGITQRPDHEMRSESVNFVYELLGQI
ncbi:hypothetical protein [Moorena producens]|uniref:hypothetical protein n=1 Tax=Moorena producens TaxID=1155739 RepID=UPI0011EA6EA6|nr:hypothetical protein [Moorena producens]